MELITELRKLGLTFDQCCEVEQLLAPKGVCISLFHGRNSPNEELEDWGFDGAVIMNVGFSWTYGGIKIHEVQPDGTFGDMVTLSVHDDMIVLDNKYYGDFEICTIISPIANNPARTKITFHELKALIETVNEELKPVFINGHIVDAKAPISMGDVIIRRSDNEISIANDEWNEELHDDWIKITSPIPEDEYKAFYDRLFN